MSQRRCAQLAAWGSAWLQGAVSYDEALDAVNAAGTSAVAGLPPGGGSAGLYRSVAGPGFAVTEAHPIGAALMEWKRAGAQALRLALPVAGDVRGLSGPREFREVALSSGEAVFGPGFGVTWTLSAPTVSSAARSLVWSRGESAEPASDFVALADAEHDLVEAIRETASLLARREAPSWLTDVAPALSDARRAGERLHLPASHPARAVRVIAQAERIAAVLALVDENNSGELTAAGLQERADALAPLRIAARRALLAGYNGSTAPAAG